MNEIKKIELYELFSTPIYRFKFSEHQNYKDKMMNYLSDPEIYKKNTRPGQSLHFTHPNIHKLELFNQFTNFVQLSLEQVMLDLGHEPHIQITSMWGTKHIQGGNHHRHQHHNSFLAGVYYLNGSTCHSGTRFFNPNREWKQMSPAILVNKERFFKNEFISEFEEGTLLIFPAWLEHDTGINNISKTNSDRYILGFNSMPLGPSNSDEFDRFNYQDVSNVYMQTDINLNIKY